MAAMTAAYATEQAIKPVPVTNKSKALGRERIENLLDDLRYEPPWRAEAGREMDFYDGNQLDQATLARMESLGMPPIIVNLIKPTIDSVIGMEARTRSDPLVRAENADSFDGAEALNEKLKEATRLSRFNRACADAFGSQSKVGVGWVEVSRNSDPFQYRYRVQDVSRKEMWWDWRARSPDLSDARFIIRRKWYDADECAGYFPRHARLINQAISQRPLWEDWADEDATSLARSWEVEQTTSIQAEEWRDTERNRLAIYEVWYKVFETVWVLDLPDGRVVEYDRENNMHVQAVAANLIEPRRASTHRMRVAYYLGPHQLEDVPTPYQHNKFPYVAFFGYREDRSNAPYGLIRAMKSPQEEVNARRTKMLHNLSSRRVTADADAVEDHQSAADEVARSDAYIILNENRRNANGFRVESDEGLNAQQYQLMIEAKGNVQEASGLFQEFMGRTQGGGQSGEAIKNLVEQSQQVVGEIMDNYREGRRQAAELLLYLIVEDLAKADDVEVSIERATGEKKRVMLNHPVEDELGRRRDNDVVRLRTRVALDEVPSSTTYRQQTLQRLMEIVESLPPELQAAVLDIVIASTDLPNRQDLVDRIRAVTGFGAQQQEPSTPEEAQQQAQAQQQQQAAEQEAQELEMRENRARVAELEAKVQKLMADAEYTSARAIKTAGVDSAATEAKAIRDHAAIDDTEHEQARKDLAQEADLMERGARLLNESDRQESEESEPAPDTA